MEYPAPQEKQWRCGAYRVDRDRRAGGYVATFTFGSASPLNCPFANLLKSPTAHGFHLQYQDQVNVISSLDWRANFVRNCVPDCLKTDGSGNSGCRLASVGYTILRACQRAVVADDTSDRMGICQRIV